MLSGVVAYVFGGVVVQSVRLQSTASLLPIPLKLTQRTIEVHQGICIAALLNVCMGRFIKLQELLHCYTTAATLLTPGLTTEICTNEFHGPWQHNAGEGAGVEATGGMMPVT